MKIALIGNMNNNNFALMRYFRDLGADAHLLLYSNDGQGSLSHFKPECDTWEIEKWRPYIHQTNIPNAPVAALNFPLSWLIAFRGMIRSLVGMQDGWEPLVSKSQVQETYAGYDRYVSSGITPATFYRANLDLDVFYPYSTGVEFLSSGEYVYSQASKKIIGRYLMWIIKNRQSKGIMKARYTLNYEMGITHKVLEKMGKAPKKLAIPMVYNNEVLPEKTKTKRINDYGRMFESADFTIMHHARLQWRNPGNYSVEAWRNENKNNDWLLYAFAEFIKLRPHLSPLLAIVEYGPDFDKTKKLAISLGLDNYIVWLPKMDRCELMWLLSRASIGVGEFYEVPKMIWGGTGWEALASGKPLLQGFTFEQGEFENVYGYLPPPMLPVRKQEDILPHLLDMADHPGKRLEIGKKAEEWFNRYNGIGLAKQWLELLISPRKNEDTTEEAPSRQFASG